MFSILFIKDITKDNIMFEEYSDGFYGKFKYDKNGNEIYYIDADGIEEWSEYDKNNRVIRTVDGEGIENIFEYNINGELLNITTFDDFKKDKIFYIDLKYPAY